VARYPDVQVDAVLSDSCADPVGDGFDIVIRAAAQLPDSTLVMRKIMETPMVVCASPDYIERRGTPSHPNDLMDHACLPLTAAIMTTDWIFDIDGTTHTVRVDGPISTSKLTVAHEAALAGAGIARMPYHVVAADIAAGRLVRLLPNLERVEGAVFILYPAQRTVALKTRAFINFLVDEIGSIRA
jgi:DNA-binding transcriptional LysR family regulator